MGYAEGSSYLTHAEWCEWVGAEHITSFVGDVASSDAGVAAAASSASLKMRNAASGYVDERALARGLTPPLSADLVTDVLKRRVALIAANLATPRVPEFRDDQGRGPYHVEAAAAIAELDVWKQGLQPLKGESVDDAAVTAGVSSAPRRRPLR